MIRTRYGCEDMDHPLEGCICNCEACEWAHEWAISPNEEEESFRWALKAARMMALPLSQIEVLFQHVHDRGFTPGVTHLAYDGLVFRQIDAEEFYAGFYSDGDQAMCPCSFDIAVEDVHFYR